MAALASECPICYEEITKGSGVTTLSCSHSYHLKCIAVWILKSETCPCCRKEVSEHEKIADLRNHTERPSRPLRPENLTTTSRRWVDPYSLPPYILPEFGYVNPPDVPHNEYARLFEIAQDLLHALES